MFRLILSNFDGNDDTSGPFGFPVVYNKCGPCIFRARSASVNRDSFVEIADNRRS